MANPVEDLADFIATQSAVSLIRGTDLFAGPTRAPDDFIPQNAVFVRSLGGPEPERVMGDGDHTRRALVSITVRWNRYEEGQSLGKTIIDSLQTGQVSGYLDVFAAQPEPDDLPQEREGLHAFGINVVMVYRQTP